MELDKITSEQKRNWIKNLESGKYVQGTGTLFSEENGIQKYCCLGVLAVCSGKEVSAYVQVKQDAYDFCNSILGNSLSTRCISANDCFECSFEEIALSLRGYWDIWD